MRLAGMTCDHTPGVANSARLSPARADVALRLVKRRFRLTRAWLDTRPSVVRGNDRIEPVWPPQPLQSGVELVRALQRYGWRQKCSCPSIT